MLWDKYMIFVIKFDDIFEKKIYVIVVFPMLYFVCENARDMEQPILLPLNEFTVENLNEKDDV